MSPKVCELALRLGFKPEDIDSESIFDNFQQSGKDQLLSEMIKQWLQWNFNYKKEGKHSWKTLVKAIHSINPRLAETLHKSTKVTNLVYQQARGGNGNVLHLHKSTKVTNLVYQQARGGNGNV